MTPHERLCQIVEGEVGTKEAGGNNQGERVQVYQKAVDGVAAGESWCMAFTQWAVKQVEVEMGIKSSLYSAEHCLTVWNKTPQECRVPVDKIFPGCIVIWQHGGTTNGHTGVVTGTQQMMFKTVEGNTSDGKGVNRDGDGVYSRLRSKAPTGTMKVVGFLDPFKV